jgi:hypothetical protein
LSAIVGFNLDRDIDTAARTCGQDRARAAICPTTSQW